MERAHFTVPCGRELNDPPRTAHADAFRRQALRSHFSTAHSRSPDGCAGASSVRRRLPAQPGRGFATLRITYPELLPPAGGMAVVGVVGSVGGLGIVRRRAGPFDLRRHSVWRGGVYPPPVGDARTARSSARGQTEGQVLQYATEHLREVHRASPGPQSGWFASLPTSRGGESPRGMTFTLPAAGRTCLSGMPVGSTGRPLRRGPPPSSATGSVSQAHRPATDRFAHRMAISVSLARFGRGLRRVGCIKVQPSLGRDSGACPTSALSAALEKSHRRGSRWGCRGDDMSDNYESA